MKANSRSEYAPSIIQDDIGFCFACGRCDRKLDRHEIFPASNRQKSKKYGLWVNLCHYPCHLGMSGYQYDAEKAGELRRYAQKKAMKFYGWSEEDFRRIFGKSYLEVEE